MNNLNPKSQAFSIKLAGFLLAIVGTGFSISFCSIGLGLYVAGLILELAVNKTATHPRVPQGRFLLPLLTSLLISLIMSHYLKISLRGFLKFLEGFILLYAAVDIVRTEKELRWVVGTLATVFFLAALAGVCQEFFGVDFVYFRPAIDNTGYLPPRLIGSFKHYNDYATFLVPGFAFSLALLVENISRRCFWRVFLSALLFLILAYSITRSLSRSAILAVFVSLAVFSLFFRFRWAALAGLAAFVAVIWTVPSPVRDRFQDIFAGSTAERILLFKTSITMIKAKPFFGLGLNTYSEYFPQFRPQGYDALMYAHNSFTQMASEIGLVGITLYLSFIMALLWKSVRSVVADHPLAKGSPNRRTLNIGLFSGVIGLLFNALFESLLQSTQLRTLFWSLIGISTALALNFLSPPASSSAQKS